MELYWITIIIIIGRVYIWGTRQQQTTADKGLVFSDLDLVTVTGVLLLASGGLQVNN